MIFIEVALTVLACVRISKSQRNWAWGLIPILSGLGLGFLIGIVVGLTGTDTQVAVAIGSFLDVCMVISLIWLSIWAKPTKIK